MKSRYVRIEGGAMKVDLCDAPEPRRGPGQVRVRIRRAVLNRGEFIPGFVPAVRALARDLLPMAVDGRISPVVDRVFGFAELPDAQRSMEANTRLGKLVLRIA
jgi:hypothetical protein